MGRMPCCEKAGLKKGPWTPEEDQKLTDHIQKHGPGNWRALPKQAGLERCGKSCRLRWTNYLRPDIKRGKFSSDEEEYIIQLHSVMGNKWSAIAAKLPGRTDNEIKNYWNTHIRKRLLRMGIDPVTHGPRLDLLDLPAILSALQNPSLLNMPALLNLQSLLNPEFLKLATSLASSQNGVHNGISENLLNNPFVGNSLAQNQADLSSQFINQTQSQVRNIPSFDRAHREPNSTGNRSNICDVKTEQIGFQENGHVMAEPNFDWCAPEHESLYPSAYNSAFMSNNSDRSVTSNSSGFSSVISSPLSSSANPLDKSLMYLDNSESSEDDIESFLNNILRKLENPVGNL